MSAKRSCYCRESYPALRLISVPFFLCGAVIRWVLFIDLNEQKPGLVDPDQATKSATSEKSLYITKYHSGLCPAVQMPRIEILLASKLHVGKSTAQGGPGATF